MTALTFIRELSALLSAPTPARVPSVVDAVEIDPAEAAQFREAADAMRAHFNRAPLVDVKPLMGPWPKRPRCTLCRDTGEMVESGHICWACDAHWPDEECE